MKFMRLGKTRFSKQRGFSLLEMLAAVGIFFTLAGITAVAMRPIWKGQDVTTAYNDTLTTLRRTRDQAAGDMKIYVVTFANNTNAASTITVQWLGPNATTCNFSPTGAVLLTTVLPMDITFATQTGQFPTSSSYTSPPTTPDAFGTASAPIDLDIVNGTSYSGTTSVCFNPDGTATDSYGNLAGGVVYLTRANDVYSSRAVTLYGSTGRIRGWRLYSVSGVNTWQQQ
jgi:prepilin-type N-terminal cleavage/methylation domain-containing protein